MPSSNSFGIQCVDDGTFYASKNESAFLGCCAIDPGTTDEALCPDNELRPVTFDPNAYRKITAQECLASDADALWYTCTDTSPPFLGCCSVNPCAEGSCPPSALKAARPSSNETNASSFLAGALPTKTSTTFSTTTTTTTTTTPVQTSAATDAMLTPSASATATSDGSGTRILPPATVAGIVFGIVAGIMALALLIFWLLRHIRGGAEENAVAVTNVSRITYEAHGTTPPTPPWLYGVPSPRPRQSSSASEYRSRLASTANAMPPDYHMSAARAQKTANPTQLLGSFRFEMAADSPRTSQLSWSLPRSPHNR